jgi:hypothetical protein
MLFLIGHGERIGELEEDTQLASLLSSYNKPKLEETLSTCSLHLSIYTIRSEDN